MIQRVATSIVFLILFCSIAAQAAGQFGRRFQRTEYFRSKVQVAGSRLANQNIEKAKKDIANGEFGAGVRLIQETIDKYGDRAISTETNRYVGIRDYCNRLIRELPEAGLKAYHAIYDPYAKNLLELGTREQDLEVLKKACYRYQNTPWGKQALTTAISLEFESGKLEPTRDLSLLYRSAFGDDADSLGPLSALILASAFMNDDEQLSILKRELTPQMQQKKLELGSQAVTLGSLLDFHLARIASLPGKKRRPAPRASFFKNQQWLHEIPTLSRRERTTARCDDFRANARPSDFPWNPSIAVVDEGSVYVSNGVFVRALELYSDQQKWQYDGWVKYSQARQSRAMVLPLTLADNIVYASLETPLPEERTIWTFVPQQQIPHRQLVALDSSTGKVLWQHYRWRGKNFEESKFVANLNINSEPLIIGDRLYVSASRFHTSYHQYLVCFDRYTGDLMWSTFIATGQMEQNMFGNRVREAISGQLVEKDGLIFHSTNIGVIAAVDARLGTLKYTATYEQIEIPRQTRFDTRIHERAPAWSNNKPIVVGDEVYVAPMDCQELLAMNRHTGKVRGTGVKRTTASRFRYLVGPHGPWIIAAGAGLCFYNTKTGHRIEPNYTFARGRRDQPARMGGIVGRPIIQDGKLIAPVNSRGLEKFFIWSIDDQRVIDEVSFNPSNLASHLGNLTEKDGVIVSATASPRGKIIQVRCFFNKARVQAILKASIAANPNDPKAHFRMGEFALQGKTKDYKAALSSFEAARTLADEGSVADRVWATKSRNALSRLYLELAEQPRRAQADTGLDDLTCYRRACEIATIKTQKVDILFRMLRRAFDRRDRATFATTYDRLRDEFQSVPYDYGRLFKKELPQAERRRYPHAGFLATAIAAEFAVTTGEPSKAISYLQEMLVAWPNDIIGTKTSWEYGYGKIEDLIAKYGPKVYATLDRRAQSLFDESKKVSGIKPLQLLLARYPNAKVVPDAYNEISRRQFAAGQFEEAASGLLQYFAKFRQLSGNSLATLAKSLEARKWNESALDIWRRLRKLDVHDLDDPSLLELADIRIAALTKMLPSSTPRLGKFALTAQSAWKIGLANDPNTWELVLPEGSRPDAAEDLILAKNDRTLYGISVLDGTKIWRIDAHNRIRRHHARWQDGRLLLHVDDAILCLDPTSGDELWRFDPGELEISGFAAGQGKVFVALEARGFPINFRLRALSIMDGATISQRIMDGVAQGEAMQCGARWLMVPLQSRLACLLVDGFTLNLSKAWPEGADFDDDCEPFLAPDDNLISIPRPNRSMRRELTSRNPETGQVKWRRQIRDFRIRFYDSDSRYTIYKVGERDRSSTSQLMIIDNLSGSTFMKNTMENHASVVGEPTVTGNNVFVLKSSLDSRRRQNTQSLENLDVKTNSTVWRSMSFRGTKQLAAFPYQEGVVLRIVERLKGTRSRKTSLFLIDRANGRTENEIELDSRRPSHVPGVQFLNGHLIVTDGPVLKVFKP